MTCVLLAGWGADAEAVVVQRGAKLAPVELEWLASFGDSVALSADGRTALVGAGSQAVYGAVWTFTRDDAGSPWTQQGPPLRPSDAVPYAHFGTSLAITPDGDTAIIGGKYDDDWSGAAWVFVRSDGVWSQRGPKLVPSDTLKLGNGPLVGDSVALSADGRTALVGGPEDGWSSGAAWVFVRDGDSWTQQGPKLMADEPATWFGDGVALSADGDVALVESAEAAWPFRRNGGSWAHDGPSLHAGLGAPLHGRCSCAGRSGHDGGHGPARKRRAARSRVDVRAQRRPMDAGPVRSWSRSPGPRRPASATALRSAPTRADC